MKLLCGVGINDADYKIRIREELPVVNGKRKQKIIWVCPFFQTWRNMIIRAYSKSVHKARKTYCGVTVCTEWLTFSKFKAWMEQQDWEGKQLDKDLLSEVNKIYSPETCVFISRELNSFLSVKTTKTTDLPLGVHRYRNGRFVAQCYVGKDSNRFLGYFDTPEEAHEAWKKQKISRVMQLIDEQTDNRVIAALISKFELRSFYD